MGRRKFDHDEARRMYAEGLSNTEIGRRLGVNSGSVYHAIHGYPPRNGLTACVDCGKALTNIYQGRKRCRPCHISASQTRFRRDEQGSVAAVRCGTCHEWKPPTDYPHNASEAEGIHGQCRPCQTAARRDYRRRHREANRAYDRDYKRRKRAAAKASALIALAAVLLAVPAFAQGPGGVTPTGSDLRQGIRDTRHLIDRALENRCRPPPSPTGATSPTSPAASSTAGSATGKPHSNGCGRCRICATASAK